MTALPIPLRSNPGAFDIQGEPRLINCYAEEGGNDQKAPAVLIPCAGQKRFSTSTGSPCRGMIFIEEAVNNEGRIYSANGFGLYSIEQDGTQTKLLTISGNKNAFFARNDILEVECVTVVDDRAYVIKNNAATFKRYGFTPSGVTFCSGYFVFWIAEGENKGRFYASNLNGTDVDALSFATAEGDPDGLTKAHGSIDTLYLIGKRTTEIWSINGSGNFPFSKSGAHLRFGSDSPYTVQDFANAVAWVDNNNQVVLVSGYDYRVISTDYVSRLIEGETDKANLVAFTYTRSGNRFYCLQGSGWTVEYNAKTDSWHDRRTGPYSQWDSLHHVKAWSRDIFGSRSTGEFSENDTALFTENGGVRVWGFDTYTVHNYPNGLSFDRLNLDMKTGVGDNFTPNPLLMLSWSDDNGKTFTSDRHLALAARGNHSGRVQTHRLGSCGEDGRIFRVRISDPVVRAISQMDIEASQVRL